MVLSPNISRTARAVTAFPGTKSRSYCRVEGKIVACVTEPLDPDVKLRGSSRQTLRVVGKDDDLLVAATEREDVWLMVSWKHSAFHYAQTSLTPKGVFQKQCVGRVVKDTPQRRGHPVRQ